MWDLETGELAFHFTKCHSSKMTCMAFDDAGRRLITGGNDGSVSAPSPQHEHRYLWGETMSPCSWRRLVSWFPARYILTRGGMLVMQVRVWNFSNGQCLRDLTSDATAEISSILFLTEMQSRFIVAGGWNRKVSG